MIQPRINIIPISKLRNASCLQAYACNTTDGSVVWSFATRGMLRDAQLATCTLSHFTGWVQSSPLFFNETVYIGSGDGYM